MASEGSQLSHLGSMAPGVPSSQAYLVTRTLSPHGIQYTAAMTRGDARHIELHSTPPDIKAAYLAHTGRSRPTVEATPSPPEDSTDDRVYMTWARDLCRQDAISKHPEHVRHLPDLLLRHWHPGLNAYFVVHGERSEDPTIEIQANDLSLVVSLLMLSLGPHELFQSGNDALQVGLAPILAMIEALEGLPALQVGGSPHERAEAFASWLQANEHDFFTEVASHAREWAIELCRAQAFPPTD